MIPRPDTQVHASEQQRVPCPFPAIASGAWVCRKQTFCRYPFVLFPRYPYLRLPKVWIAAGSASARQTLFSQGFQELLVKFQVIGSSGRTEWEEDSSGICLEKTFSTYALLA